MAKRKTTHLSIRITPQMHAQLAAVAKALRVGVGGAVRALLSAALDRHEAGR